MHNIGVSMKVYLLSDVENVGFEGEIITTTEGYAKNFLVPRKLGVVVTAVNEAFYKSRVRNVENRKEAVKTKTSMLAEKIKATKLSIKRKMHEGKLYGAISAQDIVELLAQEGISVAKNQILFDKSIKEKGTFDVVIKLSSKLQPALSLKVSEEKEA